MDSLNFVNRNGVRIATRYTDGKGPTLVFLPGYMSDMTGSKATALFAWAQENDRACLLFDYSGCGQSSGEFADATFEIWHDDAMAAINSVIDGAVILVGSSMGGWIMLMLAEAMGNRVSAMVGIAAAPDFTVWGFDDAQRETIMTDGVLLHPNVYGPEPTPTHRTLYQSGERNQMLGRTMAIDCPVRLIQGQCDDDVPWKLALKIAQAIRSSDVQVHLIKDGDHRLSRPSDIALLLETIARLF